MSRTVALSFENRGNGDIIGIDDFGVGYSNFSHVVKLNVDFLKIDASLVKNIETDETAQVTVRSIVSFARELGIKTIGEYVHSQAVYETINCTSYDLI